MPPNLDLHCQAALVPYRPKVPSAWTQLLVNFMLSTLVPLRHNIRTFKVDSCRTTEGSRAREPTEYTHAGNWCQL